MYDTLICSPNSNPTYGGTLPRISSGGGLGGNGGTKSSIEFSSLKRKSHIDVPTSTPIVKKTELIKKSSINLNIERKRPPDPPPAPPIIVHRPLSISSMASISSTSSSSVSSCGHVARIRRTGVIHNPSYLASLESLDVDMVDTSIQQRRPKPKCSTVSSHGSGDSGVCSPCSFISSPSPITRPRYCDPQLSYMDRVVMEIVETEGVYVSDLQQVIVGYLERWRSSPDYPFSDEQLNDLFSNIQDIFHFNKSFLGELEQCGLDPVKIAKSFVSNNEGFSVYTDYCTNYPTTMSVLTELMRKETAAKLFRERQIALQHTLPLGSYLLKPVQRILKYHLLLQNIVKHCSADVEGYSDIVDALSTMTSIAKHINDMKRRHEHAVRVQEIQSLLLGWQGEDLTTFGELCAEGAFRMAGAKALRHVFLFDKMLLITKKKEEGILGYKAHIMCSNLMLIESIPGELLSFHVIPFDNPKFQYTLQSRNLDQKREWCLQLKKVILENYNAVIPSHARQLVMQLGQNRPGDEELAEKHVPKRQHSAPEYLEKRKQEKNRRKSELCLLRNRLNPRPLRKSDVGTCEKSQEEIRRSFLMRKIEQSDCKPDVQQEQCDIKEEKDETLKDNETTTFNEPKHEKLNGQNDTTEESIKEEEETSTSIEDEHKTLEKIISQLLMQNGDFQKLFNKQKKLTRRRKTETSEDEEECDYDNLSSIWGESPKITKRWLTPPTTNNDNWGSPKLIHKSGEVRRAHSFSSQDYENSSPDQSVDSSLSRFSLDKCNNTSLWVKHQPVTESNKKSDSLPRSFQIGGGQTPHDWTLTQRPVTIASDKAQELNLVDMQNYINRAEEMCTKRNCFPTNLDDTTEEEFITPDLSSQQLYIHPEYRIYKSGLSKTVLRHVINKITSLRSNETLDECEVDKKMTISMFSMFRPKLVDPSPCYKQGSSRLGARIAHTNDNSDYADPRTLFPSITPSKKAAALLGIRPCSGSVLSIASNGTDTVENVPYKSPNNIKETKVPNYNKQTTTTFKQINEFKLNELRLKLSQTRIEIDKPNTSLTESITIPKSKDIEDSLSVGSADSFYERSFEAMENMVETGMFRDSAVFSDQEDDFSDEYENIATIPPPKQFDEGSCNTIQVKEETSKMKTESAQHIKTFKEDIVTTSQFKGETLEISNAEIKKLNSKLDIIQSNNKKKDSSTLHKLCIVKPFGNPLENVTRNKKIIQISKISLNSIPNLEIKNSEKYIKDSDFTDRVIKKLCKSNEDIKNCKLCNNTNEAYRRRNSCKSSIDCTQCKISRQPVDMMSQSYDFSVNKSYEQCQNYCTKNEGCTEYNSYCCSSSNEMSKSYDTSSEMSKSCEICSNEVIKCKECIPNCNLCDSQSIDSTESKLSSNCDFEDSSSAASTVIEVSRSKQGWVKHVVNRLQSF